MRTDRQRAVIFNIWVGIIGAVLGAWLLSLFAGAQILGASAFSIASLSASFLGAVIFLAIMNLVRSGIAPVLTVEQSAWEQHARAWAGQHRSNELAVQSLRLQCSRADDAEGSTPE